MKRLFNLVLFVAATFHSVFATANYVVGSDAKIITILTSQTGNTAGDVMIKTDTPVAGCESGYFIPVGTRGLEEGLSVALSAFHAGAKVKIDGTSGMSWAGTSRSDYCQVYSISIMK